MEDAFLDGVWLAAGVDVTSDSIAADLIKRVGPQGESYLTQEHTLERLRSDEYFVPDLAVRGAIRFVAGCRRHGHRRSGPRPCRRDADAVGPVRAHLTQLPDVSARDT